MNHPNSEYVTRIINAMITSDDDLLTKIYDVGWQYDWKWANSWNDAYNNAADKMNGEQRTIWYALWNELQDKHSISSRVGGAILCLIAYPDCGYMLDGDVDELKLLVALGKEQALLLIHACILLKSC